MSFEIADGAYSEKSSKLWKNITVMRLAANQQGDLHDAGLSELPKGAEVDLCGVGFNKRTVKLRWRGEFFIAFVRDLECPLMDCCALRPPPRDCPFRLRVLKDTPITYRVSLCKVEDFARHGIPVGPTEVVWTPQNVG